MALPSEAAALFHVEPKGFVAARNELSARLRAEGRETDAASVKALRKPTVIVWALDQLAARDPGGVGALLDAGRELRAAQQATMSSQEAKERLRVATAARREVIANLTTIAVTALNEVGTAGRSQADAIAAALESASIDDKAGARLAAGTLETVPDQPAGFGDLFGLTAIEGGRAKTPTRAPKERAGKGPDLARLRRERDAAAKAERTDREEADRIQHELAGLRDRITALEAAHMESKTRARASALAAKRAERALTRAERTP
jgi:hypothetical protein